MFSGGIERDQWHEMSQVIILNKNSAAENLKIKRFKKLFCQINLCNLLKRPTE